jgi:thiol reductant ABC exporter CydC subunit
VLAGVVAADARVGAAERRSAYGRGGGAAVCAFAAGAALWGALALGAAGVRSGAVAGVTLAVLVLIPLATHEVFGSLAPAAQEIPRLRVAAARVADVMSRPDPVTDPAQPAELPGPPYHLAIRDLDARWCEDGSLVLHQVNLEVAAGQRIAVTGPSGCGKTTLAMTLLRFLEPAGGTITLGGTDIRALSGAQVRLVIGLCAQDAHIFASTLRENLQLARRDATADELTGALAGARLLDWVRTLPDGLDTRVGERGAQLSGGQRQRLALARVLLADFPVVIFDEPAEHLDDQTADALTRDLLTATEGKTVLLITHRAVDGLPLDKVLQLTGNTPLSVTHL